MISFSPHGRPDTEVLKKNPRLDRALLVRDLDLDRRRNISSDQTMEALEARDTAHLQNQLAITAQLSVASQEIQDLRAQIALLQPSTCLDKDDAIAKCRAMLNSLAASTEPDVSASAGSKPMTRSRVTSLTIAEAMSAAAALLQVHHGLDISIQSPKQTHISRHHKSATDHPTQVRLIIDKEITSHRYYGPLDTRSAVEELIGPFQTAPLGLRPKPNGQYRLIQDFSYHKTPRASHHPSINSRLDISLWPTTWYTFSNTCATILSLPRTAQAYVRDVTSAFRQIPLHSTQWAGTVMDWEGKFYIDQFLAFGLRPACGAFGLFADAFADICRANGIGPTGHWVDDNVSFRVGLPTCLG